MTTKKEDVSYVRTSRGIEPKMNRPKTISDARQIVEEVFMKNRWDARSQKVFMENHGVNAVSLAECSADEVRILLKAMDESRMAIFRD